ncbi:MAG: MBL fold metallo-hydrolase [Bacillota bacterium]|jgi:glyoxylase-like metal-dependent hydrolase (beta-lactamase superfamily II)
MKLDMVAVGAFQANCYILGCERTKEGLVIDPGSEPKRILDMVARMGLRVTTIVNTHAHVDHIGANLEVKNATGADLLIHEADEPYTKSSLKNLTLLSPFSAKPGQPDRLLKEGDSVLVGQEISLEVIHTPGHTPGGICLYGDGILFTGDTLFSGSIGRTDLPGGNLETLIASIREKLLILPEDTLVYPGHGPSSTIGDERSSNPFL